MNKVEFIQQAEAIIGTGPHVYASSGDYGAVVACGKKDQVFKVREAATQAKASKVVINGLDVWVTW